ncbi:hypothetical protein [Atrimonas thermophila]|uniref:primosomal protein N' family DNA-binding protein n=1 Tax=Atrimonas thermophila TaxID=3064161 RepID=UPI00399C6362
MLLAQVALPVPLFQTFSYFVPEKFINEITPGSIVQVDFHSRKLTGVVVELAEHHDVENFKEILQLLPLQPLTTAYLDLAKRLSIAFFAPLGEILALYVPKISALKRSVLPSKESCPRDCFLSHRRFLCCQLAFEEDRFRFLRQFLQEHVAEKKEKTHLVFPELAMLDRYAEFIQENFPDLKLIRFDSRVSPSKRFKLHQEVVAGTFDVIVGSNLSLFLPTQGIHNYLIIDPEERGHFSSKHPYYNSLTILEAKVKVFGGMLIALCRIPNLYLYFCLLEGKWASLKPVFESRGATSKKVTTVVQEKPGKIFSLFAQKAISENLRAGIRSLILVQKSGYAAALGCKECGFYYSCAMCNIAMRFHAHSRQLICPLCGQKLSPAPVCPRCGGTWFEGWGAGTEKVEEELKKLFPGVGIQRIDFETLEKGKFEIRQDSLLLVGTTSILQEKLLRESSLLIIESLEDWFLLPDFEARERFLLSFYKAFLFLGEDLPAYQAKIIIQTRKQFQDFLNQFPKKWQTLFQEEIEKRKRSGYPPFRAMVRIAAEGRNKKQSFQVLNQLRELLVSAQEKKFDIFGPYSGEGFRKRGTLQAELTVLVPQEDLEDIYLKAEPLLKSAGSVKVRCKVSY